MKHTLTLTDADGVILGTWIIEDDFGDIERPLPRAAMSHAIFDEWKANNDSNATIN